VQEVVHREHAIAIPAPQRVRRAFALVGQRVRAGNEIADADLVAAGEREIGAAQALRGQRREPFPVVECGRQARTFALELRCPGLAEEILEPALALVAFERARVLHDQPAVVVAPHPAQRPQCAPPLHRPMRERFGCLHGIEFREPRAPRRLAFSERPLPLEKPVQPRKKPRQSRARATVYLVDHARELGLPDPELTSVIAVRALEAVIHGVSIEAPERLRDPRFVDEVTELFVRYVERS